MKIAPCCKNGTNSQNDYAKISDFLKIISEPNRLKILCLLKQGEQCVCGIWKNLGIQQNLTSHHLKTLKDFGLIDSRQDGRNIHYSSNKETINKYTALLNNFFISNL